MTLPHTLYFTYVRKLSPGDRVIANTLAGLVLIACVVALVVFARGFMVAQPAYGGSLTEGVVGTPQFVNPLLAISDTDRDLTALTYAGLMGHDGAGKLVPVLASSYEESADGKTYTFTLRPNATFSDGTPVTAADVVFTITKAQDPGLKSPVLANWANIRAEVVDARTVRFTLPKPYAPFLEDTTLGILPAHVWKDIPDAGFPFSPHQTMPIGAGPFKVTRVVRANDGSITSYDLVAFKGYAPGRAYLNSMRVFFYDDQQALASALHSGTVESASGVASAHAIKVPYRRVFGVFFNAAKEPLFAKKEVRQALSIAIDRQALVQDVLDGYATPNMGPVPPSTGIDPLAIPDSATRLDQARQVLTAAKWKFDASTNTWRNGSTTLAVTIDTSNVPELKAEATQIKKDWEALGVPTTIQLHDSSALMQDVIRPRAYGALLFGEVIGRSPDLFAFWSSTERADPGLNIANYSDKTADALLQKLRTEQDPAAITADLNSLNTLIAGQYPAAFTHAPDFLYAVPTGLHGVTLTAVSTPSERFDDVAHWYRNTEYVWPAFAQKK